MYLETFPVGSFQCNCSILICEKTREALVVDPGDEAPRILDALKHLDVKPRALIHTHAHIDHISAAGAVKADTGAAACLHRGDQWLWDHLDIQGQMLGLPGRDAAPAIDRYLEEGDEVDFGEHRLKVIHTPGHTPGSICFHMERESAEPLLFSGDTLFARSIGRTDLWGGSHTEIIRSIKSKLLTLDGATEVITGHGPSTHIETEARSNPFLT